MAIFNPNAAAIIYNYIDRQGSYSLKEKDRDEVEKIVLKSEITSIQTQKAKSQPAGSFEIVLAPTRNWATALTPGSWLSIHMSPNNKDLSSDPDKGLLSYGPKTLKMIGRIDTVQMSVSVNDDGTRMTSFVVRGKDWGQVFETILYIDPMASISGDEAIEQAVRFGFDAELAKNGGKFFTTTNILRVFVRIWGMQNKELNDLKEDIQKSGNKITNVDRLIPSSMFHLPKQLSNALAFKNKKDTKSTLAGNILIKSGKLEKYDTYKDEFETCGPINTGSIIGGNTVWQVLNAHSGSVINEMLTDFRWENDRVNLTMYKRVRPFLLVKDEDTIHGRQVSSSFFKVKRTEIKQENVLAINAGTNWRDRFNFVEVLPQLGHMISGWEPNEVLTKVKGNSAYDPISFGRDGFKPLLFYTPYLPCLTDGTPGNAEDVRQWVPVLKNWYFDTHKMLNGTIAISNQEEYISVGENISIDGNLFTSSSHVEGDKNNGNGTKVLAHVESVENTFIVNPNTGARTFYTNVSFVRGVFTDVKYTKTYGDKSYGIDSNANSLNEKQEKLTNIHKVKEND